MVVVQQVQKHKSRTHIYIGIMWSIQDGHKRASNAFLFSPSYAANSPMIICNYAMDIDWELTDCSIVGVGE